MKTLSNRIRIGYGIGDLACNLVFQLTVIYLLFFYTDVLGISALAAGTIFLIARIWDAINDPIMGMIVDKTRSRFGKARVYILYGSLPLAISTVLLFYAPDTIYNLKIIYATITYILWGMLFTLVNIPYSSLSSTLTNDTQERTVLSSVRMIFMLIGVILVSVLVEPIVNLFEAPAHGYFRVAILFGTLAFIFFIMCFLMTKTENSEEEVENKGAYSLKEIIPIVFQNKELIILTSASFLGNIAVFIRESAAIYYVSYNIGDGSLLPVFLGVVVASMLIGNLIIPFVTKLYDKKKTYIYGSVIGIIGSIVFHFIPYNSIPLVMVFAAISSFGFAAISTLGWAMVPDTVEYGEAIIGIRSEGIIFAVYSFSQKLAMAIAALILGGVLDITKYKPNVATQAPETLSGILSTITIIPIIFCVLSALVINHYSIDRYNYKKILNTK